MISRSRLHSEVLKVINETCGGMSPVARSRLAVEISKGLHPVIVEQIMREVEKVEPHQGGYPAPDVRLEDLPKVPAGPGPGQAPVAKEG